MKTSAQSMLLLVSLIMFPQIAETIYSPALTDIANAFAVDQFQAGQTLSVYFGAFAAGVVCWGLVADLKGRRPALLAGLALYTGAAISALFCKDFSVLLLLRGLSAFGAASCSIVVQTMLRDSFEGAALGRAFALIGMGISISPAVGMLLGGAAVTGAGYMGMFALLGLISLTLLSTSWLELAETQPKGTGSVVALSDLVLLTARMLADKAIWRSAVLVAGFNLMLFAYFQLAPFLFESLGMDTASYSFSGVLLAAATLAGSLLNQKLLKSGWRSENLVFMGVGLALVGATGVLLCLHSKWFVVMQLLICISFALAVPNVLCDALKDYRRYAGSAGAVLGLFYYSLLGAGLGLAGVCGNLGWVLTVTAGLMLIIYLGCRRTD